MEERNARRRRRMVRGQRRRGEVTDVDVLAAMSTVPREEFVPDDWRDEAYDERALPIEEGQTISQPVVVATMTQALELSPTDRVLEVGTGSGYQAAVLRQLVGRVVSVERVAPLARRAQGTLARLGIDGVDVHCGDGTMGWPTEAPFDAIVVTAGGPVVPQPLLTQLAPGGRLVMPVGPRGAERLVRIRRSTGGEVQKSEDLGPVAFVPLVGREGWPDAGSGGSDGSDLGGGP